MQGRSSLFAFLQVAYHCWDSHADVCVSRPGMPTHCGSASWVSSGRCQSLTVCGFPEVWVVCKSVCGGLRLVAGGCLVLVRGGCSFCVVSDCLRLGSPSSTSASTSCLSHPVLPRRLCGLSVEWDHVGRDLLGGESSVGGGGVTPHQHWRRRVGRIEHHDRCL